ncbi:Nitrogen regulatory protein P-II, nitrogen-fixation associated, subunit B [hydrothermal vent metagenome]|uniref:Nitrogen regulatory protein P-II, nitrogen-fixation associated, subunit B n=1 Tax=hydrothermal vent metagenome TaxID=652676 RepID=A0A3B1CJ96_9ZZZZ
MKEIVAIIRRDKVPEIKQVLEDLGYPSLTIQSVDGRGKQKGAMCAEMDSEMPDSYCTAAKLKPTPSTYALEHTLPKVALYVPKRMLTIVVPDDVVTKIVKSIIKVSYTGKHGDGKIFVAPIGGAVRIRTGETDGEAIA